MCVTRHSYRQLIGVMHSRRARVLLCPGCVRPRVSRARGVCNYCYYHALQVKLETTTREAAAKLETVLREAAADTLTASIEGDKLSAKLSAALVSKVTPLTRKFAEIICETIPISSPHHRYKYPRSSVGAVTGRRREATASCRGSK